MSTHSAKVEQPKAPAAAPADRSAALQSNSRATTAFVDNRPSAAAHRQQQALINNSPRMQQAATQQALIAQSPRQQAAQLQAVIKPEPAAPVAPSVNNTGLPDGLKAGVEQLSGYSLDDVQVHYNSAKPAQLQAHAYAQGTDIHVAPGQEKHLPHEAWHVVQQKQGRVRPTRQLKGKVAVNDDAGLEKEADVMGNNALQMKKNKPKPPFINSPDVSLQTVQLIRNRRMSTETEVEYNILVEKFNSLKTKGAIYIQALNNEIFKPEQADVNHDAAYAARYAAPAVKQEQDTPANVSAFAGKAALYTTKVKGGVEGAEPYVNYMDAKKGRIIANYNYAVKDVNTAESGETIRLSNSEILFQQYKAAVVAANEERITVDGLTEVVRSSIQNKDTMAIIDLCITKVADKFKETIWEQGTDEFNALLGTDNCKGVAFMLKDHATAFGKKTITSIVTKGANYIRIKIGASS